MNETFKTCPKCKKSWNHRESFLDEHELVLLGYQANIMKPDSGLFVFQHAREDCHTSLSVKVSHFLDLYPGPRGSHSLNGTELCEGHCARVGDFSRCSQNCSNAYVREVLLIILERLNRSRALHDQH